jgi:hypothetical protein
MEKEIIVKRTDKFERFYIKPTISSQIIKGVSIGIWIATVCFILFSFFVWNTKINIAMVVVALLFPFLFSKRNIIDNANFVIQE